jgi:general nucleoside transport system permease protein
MGPFDAALLASAIGLTVPILLAASGETLAERAGVLNVGLEGMILAGAFFSFLAVWETGSVLVGLAGGVAAGAVLAALMALVTVDLKGDQIVAGIGINVLAIGITTLAYDQIFGDRAKQALVDTVGAVSIPGLSSLGGVGEALFDQDPITYLAFLLVPVLWFVMYRTTWGLAVRAAGEEPVSADTAGVSVRATRWWTTLAAGGLSGLAGSYLAIVQLGLFRQEMSAGRGFLALAAVIFGRWHPVGVLLACLVFGTADALQLRLQGQASVPHEVWLAVTMVAVAYALQFVLLARGRPVAASIAVAALLAAAGVILFATRPDIDFPSQLWLSLPFLLALLALAGAAGRAHMPSALTLAYRRGDR